MQSWNITTRWERNQNLRYFNSQITFITTLYLAIFYVPYNRFSFVILKLLFLLLFVLAAFRLSAIWLGRHEERQVVFLDCTRLKLHRQIVVFITHAVLEHCHTLQALWKGTTYHISNNFTTTLHLLFCIDRLSLLLFLPAVIKFVVFYAIVASPTDSDKHPKIFQRLYHW